MDFDTIMSQVVDEGASLITGGTANENDGRRHDN
jgi:hypothetical protein